MLPTQLLWLCNPVAHAFQIPALCKVRKGRGTHYVFGASEVKSLGHPPDSNSASAASVLDTRCTIGVGGSPLLQALDQRGRDAGVAELFC